MRNNVLCHCPLKFIVNLILKSVGLKVEAYSLPEKIIVTVVGISTVLWL